MVDQNSHVESSKAPGSKVIPDPTPKPLRCGTVLVVDDEECSRCPVAELLRREGYGILLANDSRDAVTEFQRHSAEIAAVLLDYHMPGGTGAAVFEQLHRIRPDVPVIMMSGFVEEAAITRFMGMGVAAYLQKPFRGVTLTAAVRKALDPPAV